MKRYLAEALLGALLALVVLAVAHVAGTEAPFIYQGY
jgi:hypothetical protein